MMHCAATLFAFSVIPPGSPADTVDVFALTGRVIPFTF